MKNLFKSLMLVAVAAMAFTACQNEPEVIVNNGAESTTITFDATFADTRSYFGEKEGEGYPSSWSGNEVAKFNHWTSAASYEYIEVPINGEDRFSVTFNALSEGNTVDAYVPAASWSDPKVQWDDNSDYIEEVYRDYTIPAEQNPSATSVDEKAHILKATTTYDGSNTMTLNFEHQVAYGKLSVQNFDGGEISQYAITIDGKMYVVNSTRDAGVWFACNPVVKVQDMTISVVAANGTYTKTVIEGGNKPLAFNKGRVSTFTVDFYGKTPGEAVDTFNPDVLATNIVWDAGYYKMTGEVVSGTAWGHTSDYIRLYLNEADRPNNNSIIAGTYTGCGSDAPAQGQFGCRMSQYWGTVTRPTAFTSASTLDVKFADNVYTIVLTHNGTTYGYKGMPDGWTAPGKVKTALATPEVSAEVVNDKNVNVTWNAVDNAANYTVSVNGVEKEAANTTCSYTIEGTYSTEYTITVVANPAVDSEDYKESAAGSATVTTNADPNAEEPEEPGEGGGEEPEQPEQPGETIVLTTATCSRIDVTNYNFVFNGGLSFNIKCGSTGFMPLMNGEYTFDLTNAKTEYTIYDVKVNNDIAATSASGSVTCTYNENIILQFNNVVIDSVNYTGTVTIAM